MRKFENLGKMKYNKSRVVGSKNDQEISSIFSMATGSSGIEDSTNTYGTGDDGS